MDFVWISVGWRGLDLASSVTLCIICFCFITMGEIKYIFTLQGLLTILQGLSENEKYMPKTVVCRVSSLACNKAVQINGLLIQVLLPMPVALGIEAYYSHSNSPVPFPRMKRNCWSLWKNSQYFGEVFSLSLFPIASRFTKNKHL